VLAALDVLKVSSGARARISTRYSDTGLSVAHAVTKQKCMRYSHGYKMRDVDVKLNREARWWLNGWMASASPRHSGDMEL
jgi:hypothetical protein